MTEHDDFERHLADRMSAALGGRDGVWYPLTYDQLRAIDRGGQPLTDQQVADGQVVVDARSIPCVLFPPTSAPDSVPSTTTSEPPPDPGELLP